MTSPSAVPVLSGFVLPTSALPPMSHCFCVPWRGKPLLVVFLSKLGFTALSARMVNAAASFQTPPPRLSTGIASCILSPSTIAVTSCSCERTFSERKHVKTKLRSTISQKWLCCLMLPSCRARNCSIRRLWSYSDVFYIESA